MCTLRVLSVLLKLKEIKLQSEQCIFVAYDLRVLLLWENDSFLNATLHSVVWTTALIVYSGAAWTSFLLLAWSQHRYHVSFPSVDRQGIIQTFIWCGYQHMYCNCWYSPCMFSVSALRSAVDSGVILRAKRWQKKIWQTVNKSYANQEQDICGVFLYIQAKTQSYSQVWLLQTPPKQQL